MKTATAEAELNIRVKCPHCSDFLDVTDDLKGYMYSMTDLSLGMIKIKCNNPPCQKDFIVNEITY